MSHPSVSLSKRTFGSFSVSGDNPLLLPRCKIHGAGVASHDSTIFNVSSFIFHVENPEYHFVGCNIPIYVSLNKFNILHIFKYSSSLIGCVHLRRVI